MNFAIVGVVAGILSALGSCLVPGISAMESFGIYVIVSVFATTWQIADAWRLQPDLPDGR